MTWAIVIYLSKCKSSDQEKYSSKAKQAKQVFWWKNYLSNYFTHHLHVTIMLTNQVSYAEMETTSMLNSRNKKVKLAGYQTHALGFITLLGLLASSLAYVNLYLFLAT